MIFERQTFLEAGQAGYHTYRIPALVVTTRGTVLAVCEVRRTGSADYGDVALGLRRSGDGGRTWSKLEILADDGIRTIGNPCPVVDRETGVISLPFCRDSKQVLLIQSSDDGQTWSKPVEITKDVMDPGWSLVGTGPGHGIQLASGRLVIPCWAQLPGTAEVQLSFVFYSDDHGRSWKRSQALDRDASDECEAVELSDGRLYLTLRSRGGKNQRGYAFSHDGGQTWSPVQYDPRLTEPDCQGSIIRLERGSAGKSAILLANPASTAGRKELTVRMSEDDARTWPVEKIVEWDMAAYSDLAVTRQGEVLLLYEADDYRKLILIRFNLAWLTDAGAPNRVV